MDLRNIQYFLCLYEEKSMTRAARRLNIVQPALSMQIARLEREIDDVLFVRSSKGVVPTPAGHSMYAQFSPLVRDFNDAWEQIKSRGEIVSGKISVGLIPSVTHFILPNILTRFTSQYPHVQVSIAEGYSTTMLEWLRAGTLDFAIINHMRGQGDLELDPIIDEDMVLLARPDLVLPVSSPVRFKDLLKLKLVIPPRPHGLRAYIDSAAEAAQINLDPHLEIDALSAAQEFVQRSDYCTILPPSAVSSGLKNGLLKAYPIIEPRITRRMVWARSPRRSVSLAGRTFVTMISEEMRAISSRLSAYVRDAQKSVAPVGGD